MDVITSKWSRFDVITTLLLRHVFSRYNRNGWLCVKYYCRLFDCIASNWYAGLCGYSSWCRLFFLWFSSLCIHSTTTCPTYQLHMTCVVSIYRLNHWGQCLNMSFAKSEVTDNTNIVHSFFMLITRQMSKIRTADPFCWNSTSNVSEDCS